MTSLEFLGFLNIQSNGFIPDLSVIKYKGKIDEKVRARVFNPPPSPNMPNLETAWLYQGLCLLEGTNLSEGRGTETPFMLVGAPWLDNQKLYEKLVTIKDPMDNFELLEFIPKSIPAAKYPKYEGGKCFGLQIHFLTNPIEWTVQLLIIIK